MALIRCPSCDTLHDLDGSLFVGGPRRVRCATCREVWEATDPESGTSPSIIIPKRSESATDPLPQESATAPEAPATAPEAPMIEVAAPEQETDGVEGGAEISQEELEALFADEVPEASENAGETAPVASSVDEASEFDPASLSRAQDEANAQTETPVEKIEKERERRRTKRLAATAAHHAHETRGRKGSSMAAMLMAAGIGTLATLGLLRQETIRLIPESAALFEAVGLGTTKLVLDIRDVHGKLVMEDERETLEISGSITNLAKTVHKVPVMRLAVRNKAGQEIYVWTATADQAEIGPGEKLTFRRRLASPPAESHSVMVRFVAKDDIVSAIR
ncbi:MAG: zinc-ribbon domain-containing protein [Proteobacteria bacterium]|nr:zinc-ribbon domain-containing protein [Pseudomonadota bacterium]